MPVQYAGDYAHLRRVVPLALVLEHYGVTTTLRKSGRQWVGPCPIHGGPNRRQFVVDLDANQWRCFGDCNRGGGTLELVAGLEQVDVPAAAALIATWFAIALPHPLNHRRDTMSEKAGRPSHKVFVVEDREGQDAFWTRIGSAWPHKDGSGLNVVLSALPINGRLVLREFTEEDAKEEEQKKNKARR